MCDNRRRHCWAQASRATRQCADEVGLVEQHDFAFGTEQPIQPPVARRMRISRKAAWFGPSGERREKIRPPHRAHLAGTVPFILSDDRGPTRIGSSGS